MRLRARASVQAWLRDPPRGRSGGFERGVASFPLASAVLAAGGVRDERLPRRDLRGELAADPLASEPGRDRLALEVLRGHARGQRHLDLVYQRVVVADDH